MRVMFICCLVISCFALNCLVCSALAQKQMLFSRAGSFTVPHGAKWEASQAIQLVLQECWLMPTEVWQPQVLYRLLFYHLVVIQSLNPAYKDCGGGEEGLGKSIIFCLFIFMVGCHKPTQTPSSFADHNVTHYLCHLRIISKIAQSKSRGSLFPPTELVLEGKIDLSFMIWPLSRAPSSITVIKFSIREVCPIVIWDTTVVNRLPCFLSKCQPIRYDFVACATQVETCYFSSSNTLPDEFAYRCCVFCALLPSPHWPPTRIWLLWCPVALHMSVTISILQPTMR